MSGEIKPVFGSSVRDKKTGGEKFTIEIPKVPIVDLPNSPVKICSYNDISYLEGKLKTLVDATIPEIVGGDNNIQNKALKDVIQGIVREFWVHLTFSVDGNLYKKVKYLYQLKNKRS